MVPEGVPEMSTNSTKANTPDRGRFLANRKTDAVVCLLRGEDLETLSRELGITAALSSWRDIFLDGGTAALKSSPDNRDELIGRHGHRTPGQVRRERAGDCQAAA
jgi:transposase